MGLPIPIRPHLLSHFSSSHPVRLWQYEHFRRLSTRHLSAICCVANFNSPFKSSCQLSVCQVLLLAAQVQSPRPKEPPHIQPIFVFQVFLRLLYWIGFLPGTNVQLNFTWRFVYVTGRL